MTTQTHKWLPSEPSINLLISLATRISHIHLKKMKDQSFDMQPDIRELYAFLYASLPEVEQEPVESQFYDEGNDKWYSFMSEEHKRATIEAGYKVRDLYSHQQPKREPLSEDEIMRIVNAHEGDTIGVVRAIEQAHGIGVE